MMTDEQAAALTPEQIAALPVADVQELTAAQITAMTVPQFGALWESHEADLTEAQKAVRAAPLEPKMEAWIGGALARIAAAVAKAPSHLELLAAFEAFLRHAATVKPGDELPETSVAATAGAKLEDLEADPPKYRAEMGDGPYEAEVARLRTLVPPPPPPEIAAAGKPSLAALEADPTRYRTEMGDAAYDAEVARLKALAPPPVPGKYETIDYADGSRASGPGPLPRLSPEEQSTAEPPPPPPPAPPAPDAT